MTAADACEACLARAWLLARLAGHLDLVRDRIWPLLELASADLVAAVAGRQRAQVERELAQFDAERARAGARAAGLQAVCRCSDGYPPALADLSAPPAVLHVGAEGGVERLNALLGERPVAIVGARRASPYGLDVARALGRGLAAAGVTVVSGMASGIDTAAHRGALAAAPASGIDTAAHRGALAAAPGGGIDTAAHRGALAAAPATVAVLPGGADRPYPPSARSLHRRIRQGGAVVSELPPATPVRRWMFPARNRIIAALSAMTVVVEARHGSGALLTAAAAGDLGRPLGAVPGRITSPLAAGTHRLLRSGAQLIASPQDVLDGLFGVGVRSAVPRRSEAALAPDLRRLLDALAEGHDIAAALSAAGLPGDRGLAALASLELAGQIRREPGGRFSVPA